MIDLLRLPAAILAGVIGGTFLIVGLWYLNGLRAVTLTSVSSPGRVQQGVAEIVARVQPFGETLQAPLSGARCVGYVLRSEQRGRGFRSLFGRRWEETAAESQLLPFYLADGSGRVLVRPTPDAGDGPGSWPGGAPDEFVTDLELTVDDQATFEAGDTLPEGLGNERVDAARRYTEWRIEPQDVLYILGRVREETDAEAQLSVANDGGPFIVSETPQWRMAVKRLVRGLIFLIVGLALLTYPATVLGLV